MSDFKVTLDDLADSSALANKASQTFYPSGQPLKTSYSVNGDASRTLTQRDLQSVLAGDALYRSPNFALQISQKNTESSISGILAANPGTDKDGKGIKIKDPNSINPHAELTGSTAFAQIVASSSLGKQGLGFNLPNVFDKLSSNGETDGDGHSNTGAPFDPTKSSMGKSRPITFVDLLSSEEKEIFSTRIKEVVSSGIVEDVGKLVFTFSSQGYQSIGSTWKIYLTASKESAEGSRPILNTDSSYWSGVDGKTAYTCASMIELLLSLGSSGSGIKLQGTIGATNAGFAGAAQGDSTDMGSIGDHTFGRAFDITAMGSTIADMVYLSGKSVDNYKKALDILLKKLNTIPEYLHPDLIIIDDRLIDEYGIGQGFESDFSQNQGKDTRNTVVTNAGIIYKNYETLKRINFTGSSGHRDHIHMSFGPNRAGSYEGWLDSGSSDSGYEGDPKSGFTPAGAANDLTELGESFAIKTNALKNTNALYKALIDIGGYSPEAAAILMCIAERESRLSPASFNGKVNSSSETPRGTGDYSVGLFQMNFAGSDEYLNNKITVASLVNGKVVTEEIAGYKLIDKDYIANKVTDAKTARKKMKEWYKPDPNSRSGYGKSEGKIHSDPRLWNALTQIYLALVMTRGKKNGWLFWNWGEYGTEGKVGEAYSPSKRRPPGWLFRLKFQTAVNFYVANNPGKTAEDLKKWIKTKGVDKNLRSTKEFLDRWLQGYVFDEDGSINFDLSANTATDVPTFTKTQIKEAAIWLRDNRMDPWEAKYNEAFGCEGFANRLAAGLGLYGPAKEEIFTEEWPKNKENTNLTRYESAKAHYEDIKDSPYFYNETTDIGKNPPAGALVFWSGGGKQTSVLGHVGISLGDGTFIDQHDITPKPILGTTWPGSKYKYVGASTIWKD